jgi:DNA-directed RNA polymerase subunit K/omega
MKMEKVTKFEKARMIGNRALQIASGAPFLMNFTPEDIKGMGYNPIEIAKTEYDKGLFKIEVRRVPSKKRSQVCQ